MRRGSLMAAQGRATAARRKRRGASGGRELGFDYVGFRENGGTDRLLAQRQKLATT
jgi:hypothetical protein